MEPDSFCRELETHLCRKNDGHLVRIVGPAFEMVNRWAAQGIPFKVACRGIDRTFERYYAKGPRRRPVRLEFCEADVLDAFDEWRRAVGIGTAGGGGTAPAGGQVPGPGSAPAGGSESDGERARPGHSLRAHLDRVVRRLTDLQAGPDTPDALAAAVGGLLDRLASERDRSRSLRGEARAALIGQLERLDAELLTTALRITPSETLGKLREEAEDELAGLRERMPPEAYARALEAATARLVRERLRLPIVAYGPD